MADYLRDPEDPDCESAGRTVFIGNVSLAPFVEPDADLPNPATSMLAIDVISAPGTSALRFHFITLELVLKGPRSARFVHHSQRGNYHREVLSDPDAAIFPDPDVPYWIEANDATTVLRIREDETALLSGPGNGRTFYVGIEGAGSDPESGLTFTAFASASSVRENSCPFIIRDLSPGQDLPGYFH